MNELHERDYFLQICQSGTLPELKSWLESSPGFRINDPEAKTGNTGLHFTALSEEESKEKTLYLIRHGANPSVRKKSKFLFQN